MKKIRIRKTPKALILAAILLLTTATIMLTASAQSQNQPINAYTSLYLMSTPPNSHTPIQAKLIINGNYDFTGDTYNDEVLVIADNIVINGNGHTVYGPGAGSGCGVVLMGRSNVTIKDLTVTGWDYGFDLYDCSNCKLTDNTATNNHYHGFFVNSSSSSNTLSGNIATNNGADGFALYSSCDFNTLSGNTATGNTNAGFSLASSSNNNTLSGNTATGNTYGFLPSYSSCDNTLSGNTANSNTYGFYLYSNVANTLSGNTANNNGWSGFDMYSSNSNTLSYNNATNNQYGFLIESTSNNNYIDYCTASNNQYGFYLAGYASYNYLWSNIAVNSTNNQAYYNDSTSVGNNLWKSVAANYLRIQVLDANSNALQSADVLVKTDGNTVYASPGFGGTKPTTDVNGLTPWIPVAYQYCTGGMNWVPNSTSATVGYAGQPFGNNPRTVGMTTSHTETFQAQPPPTITSPTENAVLPTANVVVNWIGALLPDIYYAVKLDASGWINVGTSNSYTFTGLSNGTHTVNVGAFDSAGNSATDSVSFKVDTTPPTVNITNPSGGAMFNTTSVTVNWTGSDDTGIDHFETRIDGGSWINVSTSLSYTFNGVLNGTHTVDVRVFDLAGNNASDSVSFNVDTTPPTVNITSPTANAIFNTTSVTVNWTGSDEVGIDHYEVRIDSGSWNNMGTSLSHAFSSLFDGTHTAYVRAFDHAGNNATKSVSFIVDTAPPTLTITSPTGGVFFNNTNSVMVNWTGSDATSGVAFFEVKLDGGSWINVSTSLSYTFNSLSNGNYTAQVRAFDRAGNSYTASVNFTVAFQPAQSQAMLLALLLLSGTQGGTSPMVYAAVGAVGAVVVAAGLFFYFRRVQA